jgi:hypothetical protein
LNAGAFLSELFDYLGKQAVILGFINDWETIHYEHVVESFLKLNAVSIIQSKPAIGDH